MLTAVGSIRREHVAQLDAALLAGPGLVGDQCTRAGEHTVRRLRPEAPSLPPRPTTPIPLRGNRGR
jgi:hypothetical protein